MTFEQFQATKRPSEDLGLALDFDTGSDKPMPGLIYLDALYIDTITSDWPEEAWRQGGYHLLLDRREWISNDLTALELRLYEWAVSEGYFDDYTVK